MAHLSGGGPYRRLITRVNALPQGAPPSATLERILALLFTEREAALVARLPVRPFTAAAAAREWRMGEREAASVLDGLAARALLLDWEAEGVRRYVLPPAMAGFFEFSLMRVRGDLDQRLLAELLHEYVNVEDEFVVALFSGEVKLGRAFVDERALAPAIEVLDWQRASEVVRKAGAIGVSLCYCRHKAAHVGRACEAPLGNCLTFGRTADSLARHGFARRIGAAEGIDLLAEARQRGLVQLGENVREGVTFICNCCGCCCEALVAARRFGWLRPLATSGFVPVVDEARCRGCGRCVAACPVAALSLIARHDPRHRAARRTHLDDDACIGCGVCAGACRHGAITLVCGERRTVTPVDSVHRIVEMAVERGTLGRLLLDRQTAGHRAIAAVLGALLRLPPARRALASAQLRSRFVDLLLYAAPSSTTR